MNPLLYCSCILGLLPIRVALVLNCAKDKQRSRTEQLKTKRTANPHELCVPCASGVRLVWVCCAFVLSVYSYTCLGINSELVIHTDLLILIRLYKLVF